MGVVPRSLHKGLAVAPGLVASTVVTCMVGAILPPAAGSVLGVGGLLIVAVLLCGRGEAAAARLLALSRPARADELALLAPAVTMLCRAELGPPVIVLRVRAGERRIIAGGFGRRTVLVSAGLLESVADGTLPQEQAAAVIGHAAALVRAGWLRSDAAIGFWSLPWQLLAAVVTAVARVGRGLPLTSLAWRARAVVVAIAVVQALQTAQPWLAGVIGGLGAVSYAMPVWQRRWQQAMLAAGDRAVADAGLAAPWAAFLRRAPATPALQARLAGLHVLAPPARAIGPVVTR